MPPLSLQFLSDLESQDIPRQCEQPILLWANDIQQRAIYLLRCLFQKDQKYQSSGVRPRPEATGSRLCAGEFTGQEKVTQATHLGQVTLRDCEPRKGSWQLKLDSPMIASPTGLPSHCKSHQTMTIFFQGWLPSETYPERRAWVGRASLLLR